MRLIHTIAEELRRSFEDKLASSRAAALTARGRVQGESLRRSALRAVGLPSALTYVDAEPSLGAVPAVDRRPLTSSEHRAVERALDVLPAFPRNVLNGCQSRAHVTFLKLETAAPGKVFKIWLFSEQLVAPVDRSSIDYTLQNGWTSRWNYHVAVAYTAPDGQNLVVDTLLSPRAQRLEAWARRFVYRGHALAMFTSGQSYSFYLAPRTIHGVTHEVLSGFYPYSGVTQQSRDGAKAIAADALSLAFAEGRCAHCSWERYRADALSLIAVVAPYLPVPTWQEAAACEHGCHDLRERAPSAACPPLVVPLRAQPPDECREAVELFRSQVVAWAAAGL